MRIAVTGRNGQIAASLIERAVAHPDLTVLPLHRPGFDLLQPGSVAAGIEAARPDLVISAAAYTAVDQAEDEPDLAFAINADGAGHVAAAAATVGAQVIHFSTDYVFDGEKAEPYTEEDPPNPRSVYGASKLAGEEAVAAANPRHLILRTAWVYSPFGTNFVKTMLRLAAERDRVSVVADQIGNPTSALDLADATLAIAARLHAGSESEPADMYGLYHLTGEGSASWADFARAIFAASRRHGGPSAEVIDIATADYPTRASRPRNSRLSGAKFDRTLGIVLPAWREATAPAVALLLDRNRVDYGAVAVRTRDRDVSSRASVPGK